MPAELRIAGYTLSEVVKFRFLKSSILIGFAAEIMAAVHATASNWRANQVTASPVQDGPLANSLAIT